MAWKSLFVKDTQPKEEPKKVESVAPLSTANIPLPTALASGTDYVKVLDEAMKAADVPGPDYYEFSKTLAKKATDPITEQQKYRYSFDAYETQGLTAEALVASAESYKKNVLDKEKADFEAGIQQAEEQDVHQKNKLIQESEKKIAELNQQIQRESERVQQMNQEVANTINTLQTERNAFNYAYNQKTALINEHISKIKTHLNANVAQ